MIDLKQYSSHNIDQVMADITPDARFWHASQCVGDRVYVWGGCTKSYQQEKMLCFEEFNSNKRSSGWRTLTDIDPQDAHPAISQVACASYSDFLYLFGGNDGNELNNILSKLDLKKKKWERLTYASAMSPMKKDACGMAHFTTQSGEHILIVMCGYSDTSHSTDSKSNFASNKNSRHPDSGWTNEIHMFETAKGMSVQLIATRSELASVAHSFISVPHIIVHVPSTTFTYLFMRISCPIM